DAGEEYRRSGRIDGCASDRHLMGMEAGLKGVKDCPKAGNVEHRNPGSRVVLVTACEGGCEHADPDKEVEELSHPPRQCRQGFKCKRESRAKNNNGRQEPQ